MLDKINLRYEKLPSEDVLEARQRERRRSVRRELKYQVARAMVLIMPRGGR